MYTENLIIAYRVSNYKFLILHCLLRWLTCIILEWLEITLEADNGQKLQLKKTYNEMQRKGGKSKSEKKASASRENGKKGGAPTQDDKYHYRGLKSPSKARFWASRGFFEGISSFLHS